MFFTNTLSSKAIGELGTVRLAKHWSPVDVRAAVLLRRADVLNSNGEGFGPGGSHPMLDRELRETANGLPEAIPDPALLVLDRQDDLHLVGIERTSLSLRPGEEIRWWSTSRATVTSRRGQGKNLLRVVEIGDATETLSLLAECFDPRQRAALELIERATGGRLDASRLP